MDLTARTIQDRSFKGAVRGYDRGEVREYLGQVARHVSALEEQLAIASTRAERACTELDRLNGEIDARIAETRTARDRILEEARAEAAALREGVQGSADPATVRKAAAIISEAEAKATLRLEQVDAIKQDAEAQAARIVEAAERDAALRLAEADRILDKAKRDAREFRRELTRRRTIGSVDSDLVIDLTQVDSPADVEP